MTTPQTIDVGTSLYSLGVSDTRSKPSPNHLLGIIMGKAGHGKSTLIYSNPKALVINIDCASQSGPKPKASVYPCLDAHGRPVIINKQNPPKRTGMTMEEMEKGNHLTRLNFTWESVRDLVKSLEDGAAKNDPNLPEVVFLDTLDAALTMIRNWVVSKETKWVDGQKVPIESFSEMNGKSGWAKIYDEMTAIGERIRRAGIGFYYVMHLSDMVIDDPDPATDKRILIKNAPKVTLNCFSRLETIAEIIAAVQLETDTKVAQVVQKNKDGTPILRNGKPLVKGKTVERRVVRMTFDKLKCESAKRRGEITPTFELPPGKGWETFEKEYADGLEREIEMYDSDD